ncbi:MAG: DUF4238 domain-containing protein [Acinetobacter sp.]|nr:MAG: DUF4238 domain-containing protein [Acinetobacter sp.]
MFKSRRHHYVPQFLTNYFTNNDDQIFIYDKFEDKIYKGSAVNLFVENNRNTFANLEGVNDDVIERMYSTLDNKFSSVLTEISTSRVLSNSNFELLLFFAYISKWRVPQYDAAFSEAKDYFTVDDLGIGIKNAFNEKLNINLEDYFDLEMHQEIKRILLALQPFRNKDDFKRILKNSFLIYTPISSFIGDCPFNESTIISDVIFEDFVFTVTKDLTLVYSSRIDKNEIQDFIIKGDQKKVDLFLRDFSTSRDISTLALAHRNIGCCNKEYLEHLIQVYKDHIRKNNTAPFNSTVFNLLYRFKEYI